MNAETPSRTPPAVRLVSVIVPCRNERPFVDAFCDAVAAQRLPDGVALEVLVADGRSDDGTRQRLAARCASDPRFVLIDNPARIVAAGLNRCLERARGEVIARLDLHTDYDDDYLAECLAALERTGADNVGGPWRAEGEGPTQEAIAAAFQSRWVVGGARSRDLDYEGPVDTVYLGCWPSATFERHGGFDETLVRNQDDEHNLRLTRAGARVWQSARIVSRYKPRATIDQLFRQQRQYGYWKAFVMHKHGRPASWRQLAPGALVAALGVLALPALFWAPARGALQALCGAYALYLVAVAVAVARESGASPLQLVFVIAAMQLGYGLGSLRGAVDVLRRAGPSKAFAALTR